MVKKDLIIVVEESQSDPMSLEEICLRFGVSPDFIQELLSYDIISTQNASINEYLFQMAELKRIQRAIRLQRDLEVNVAGVAVILDLLEELEELRSRAHMFDKHFR